MVHEMLVILIQHRLPLQSTRSDNTIIPDHNIAAPYLFDSLFQIDNPVLHFFIILDIRFNINQPAIEPIILTNIYQLISILFFEQQCVI